MYARVTLSDNAFYPEPVTFIFDNIVDADISYYDDRFFSRIGYADFSLTFAYDHFARDGHDDPVSKFSHWWHSLDKDNIPLIYVEAVTGIGVLARGQLTEWVEDLETCELEWTCIDLIGSKLDKQVTAPALTIYSPEIEVQEQPSGPGNPPGDSGFPPIFPPGTPFISYAPQLREFFWSAINQWWGVFRGDCPALTRPWAFPYELFQMDSFVIHINAHLQTLSSGTYRVAITFKKLENVSRKEALSQLSKLTQHKITCQDGIHIGVPSNTTPITGYIANINNAPAINDIDEDIIIERVTLQSPITSSGVIIYWRDDLYVTSNILKIRNDRLLEKMKPCTEYHIWGYAPNSLTSGNRIILDGQTYTIKDISYESETMHTIRSFETVCVK